MPRCKLGFHVRCEYVRRAKSGLKGRAAEEYTTLAVRTSTQPWTSNATVTGQHALESAPWGYIGMPLAVLHLVPFAGVADSVSVDMSSSGSFGNLSAFPATSDGFFNSGELRYNLDGVVMRHGIEWHTQLFRNGSIEHVTTDFFDQDIQLSYLDAWSYQIDVLRVMQRCFKLQQSLGIVPPVVVMLSILNVTDFRLRTSEGNPVHGRALSKHQIDRDKLFLPDVVFNDFDADLTATMKPSFDCLWNAAGEEKCKFYRMNGKWKIEPGWLDPPTAPRTFPVS